MAYTVETAQAATVEMWGPEEKWGPAAHIYLEHLLKGVEEAKVADPKRSTAEILANAIPAAMAGEHGFQVTGA